ncbi:type IV toxin-antitoxin system AbiEi family antitoxin domain-containing protein [Enemella sp. A6]|uniref:type IV toxin-antitoxin system AbiEi family antitoxin domain-containing protein n=1 Tax=Enemella sp. A6 TaxID=3440152 RepID=UPI003EBC4D0A
MSPFSPIPAAVRRLLREQHGVLSREQALHLGVSQCRINRYLAEGHWHRLAPGILLAHPTNPTWPSLAWAGILIAPAQAALSGLAAAHLWNLAPEPPDPITIRLAPGTQVRRRDPRWIFERTRNTFRSIGQLPRLNAETTVLDLCAAQPDRSVHWVTEAINRRITRPERLLAALRSRTRHPVRRELGLLLADVGAGAHSALEVQYLRKVERAHRLPVGRRQSRSGPYRTDVAYDHGLIVELDGRRGHEGAAAFRDMNRDNFHALRGLTTLRFGWQQCAESPCAVAATVATALWHLGWAGELGRCRHCSG